jgi:hypothetical protein
MKRTRALPWIMLTLGALGLAACKGPQLNPIRTLLDDPSRYDHQTVRVVGKVEDAAGVLGYGIYRVNDGTGTLTVVTKQGGAPRSGATVGVEGEFRSGFTLGAETGAALVEKKRFTPEE